MSRKQHAALSRIVVSLALASVLGLAAYVILMELPAAAPNWFPLWDQTEPPQVLAQDTYTHTIFLPIVCRYCCQTHRSPLTGTADFSGEIDVLTPGDCTVGYPAETPISATGTYAGKPANTTLWVLAYAPNALYYPQSPNACQGKPPNQKNGNWDVPVYLGEKGGPPECFDIVVILTDEETSQFLGDWVTEGCKAGSYKGIRQEQLNEMAITEKGHITVETPD